MRFVVLLFGLLAVPLTGAFGVGLIFFTAFIAFLEQFVAIPESWTASPTGASHADTGLFLVLAACYGFLGVILSLMRCGWQGALLLIIPVVCAGIMNWYSFAVTAPQLFVGLLSFVVFPVPIAAPKKDSGGDEDDD